ncbi:MAG: Putative inner membrane protein, partial [uncultured Rubrobacteraceae bacterium]
EQPSRVLGRAPQHPGTLRCPHRRFRGAVRPGRVPLSALHTSAHGHDAVRSGTGL